MKKNFLKFFTAVGLAFILAITPSLFQINKTQQAVNTRTIELSVQAMDYESVLNEEFDNFNLVTTDSLTTLTAESLINLSDLGEIDNLSETTSEEEQEVSVHYTFSFDSETNIVTLFAELQNGEEVLIDTLTGVAFVNAEGNYDALFEVEGDYILLSEMQNVGMIENCGWFSKLVNKIVVAAVVVVAVAAVAAVVVATAGAGLGVVIAVGAAAGAVAGGVAGGVISVSEYGTLDWRWVAGGVVIGAALGAATGWGVGSLAGAGTAVASTASTLTATQADQVETLINDAGQAALKYSQTIINNGYVDAASRYYRAYVDNYSLITQEIMKAKDPIIESTGNFKWVVEGAIDATRGVWELVIDPVTKTILHFLFNSNI
ncbi:MAG: hypothetical protein AB7S44_03240 [Spirochaetales bacterium]